MGSSSQNRLNPRHGLNPRERNKRCGESRGSRPERGSAGWGANGHGWRHRAAALPGNVPAPPAAVGSRSRSTGEWTCPDTEITGTGSDTSRRPSRPSPLRPARRRLRRKKLLMEAMVAPAGRDPVAVPLRSRCGPGPARPGPAGKTRLPSAALSLSRGRRDGTGRRGGGAGNRATPGTGRVQGIRAGRGGTGAPGSPVNREKRA